MRDIKPRKLFELLPPQNDIYTGEEKIQFSDRHPIFKTLMKLEFEEVLRNFPNK